MLADGEEEKKVTYVTMFCLLLGVVLGLKCTLHR